MPNRWYTVIFSITYANLPSIEKVYNLTLSEPLSLPPPLLSPRSNSHQLVPNCESNLNELSIRSRVSGTRNSTAAYVNYNVSNKRLYKSTVRCYKWPNTQLRMRQGRQGAGGTWKNDLHDSRVCCPFLGLSARWSLILIRWWGTPSQV